MRNVSSGFLEESLSPTSYANAYIEIGQTRIDASNLTDITITEDIGEGGSFSIGTLNTTEASITVVSDAVEGLDLTQPIKIYFGYLVGNDFEYVPMGVFYSEPRDISHKNLLTVIRAHDMSWTLTSPYASALTFPATVRNVLDEIQTDLGLVYGTFGGIAPAYVTVYEAPQGSYRDVLAQMALLIGTNAKFNRTGALDFIKADTSATPVQEYGAFDYASQDYELTSNEPMTIGKLTVNYTHTNGDEEVTDTFVYGSGSNELTLETTNIRTQADTTALGQTVLGSGFSYYGYTLGIQGQPQLDLGDVITVTEPLGAEYDFIIMSMTHNFTGAMKTTMSAVINMESPQVDAGNISGSIKDTVESQGKVIRVVERIASNTNQYFWHTETGTDTGAHITEVPKDDFIADPTNGGGNMVARSNGMAIRDGLDELATFGASGTQIGQSGSNHATVGKQAFEIANGTNKIAFIGLANDDNGDYAGHIWSWRASSETVLTTTAHIKSITSITYADDNLTPITNYTLASDGYSITITNRDSSLGIIVTGVTDSPVPYYTLGKRTSKFGTYSFVEGDNNRATGYAAHAEGTDNKATWRAAHAEGISNEVNGYAGHAEGLENLVNSNAEMGHAEGYKNIVRAFRGHAEGRENTVRTAAANAHAEGYGNVTEGLNSHVEGDTNTVYASGGHAEGYSNTVHANAVNGHAEGSSNHAWGDCSHVEGWDNTTTSTAKCSHVQGYHNNVSGECAFAHGYGVKAKGLAQTVLGEYNVEQGTNTSWVGTDKALIVGNGNADSNRSNAMALTWDGDLRIKGEIYTGCNADSTGGASVWGDMMSTYLTASQSITNTAASLNMSTYLYKGSSFSLTSTTGLIQCNFSGYIMASGWIRYSGLTNGDRVEASIGVYRNGSYIDGLTRPSFFGGTFGSGTVSNLSIPDTPIQVENGDIIALRTRNYTASRGNAYRAVLNVRRLA